MPGIDTGSLDRRVAILRGKVEDDGLSKIIGDPEEIARRWAKKTDISDGERVAAAAQGESVTSRFLMRWDKLTTTIGGDDRLLCEGVTYQVVGMKEAIGRGVGIEITAKALR